MSGPPKCNGMYQEFSGMHQECTEFNEIHRMICFSCLADDPASTKPSADPIVRQSQWKGKSRGTPKREEDQRQAAKLWSYIPVQVCTRRFRVMPPHSLLSMSLALSRKPCRPCTRHNGPGLAIGRVYLISRHRSDRDFPFPVMFGP